MQLEITVTKAESKAFAEAYETMPEDYTFDYELDNPVVHIKDTQITLKLDTPGQRDWAMFLVMRLWNDDMQYSIEQDKDGEFYEDERLAKALQSMSNKLMAALIPIVGEDAFSDDNVNDLYERVGTIKIIVTEKNRDRLIPIEEKHKWN